MMLNVEEKGPRNAATKTPPTKKSTESKEVAFDDQEQEGR